MISSVMPFAVLPSVLAWTLGAGAMTHLAAAAPEAESPVRVRLEVDTGTLGSKRVLDGQIIDAVTTALADEGVLVDPEGSAVIEIDVRRIAEDGLADFYVDINLVREDHPTQALGRTPCAKCIDDFLVEHIVGRTPQIAEHLESAEPTGVEPTAPDVLADEQSPSPPPPTTSASEPPGESRPVFDRGTVALLSGGAASTGLGLGLLIGGAAIWAKGPRIEVATTEPASLGVNDDRTLGYGLVGAGVMLLAGGATMIGLGASRRGRARRAHARLSPVTGRHSWGVTLSGSF